MGVDYSSIWDQVQEEFHCDHTKTRITRFVNSANVVAFREQCTKCGDCVKIHKKASLGLHSWDFPEWDKALPESWRTRRQARREELAADAEAERKDAFDAWYAEYLQSPEWRARRKRVMERAGGICEGCLIKPAAQVHHLTYDRVGNEMLFDLVAVCRECHDHIHAEKTAPTFA